MWPVGAGEAAAKVRARGVPAGTCRLPHGVCVCGGECQEWLGVAKEAPGTRASSAGRPPADAAPPVAAPPMSSGTSPPTDTPTGHCDPWPHKPTALDSRPFCIPVLWRLCGRALAAWPSPCVLSWSSSQTCRDSGSLGARVVADLSPSAHVPHRPAAAGASPADHGVCPRGRPRHAHCARERRTHSSEQGRVHLLLNVNLEVSPGDLD